MTLPNSEGAKELRVVAMGGGTGLSTLLRGLKQYVPMRDRRKGPGPTDLREGQPCLVRLYSG